MCATILYSISTVFAYNSTFWVSGSYVRTNFNKAALIKCTWCVRSSFSYLLKNKSEIQHTLFSNGFMHHVCWISFEVTSELRLVFSIPNASHIRTGSQFLDATQLQLIWNASIIWILSLCIVECSQEIHTCAPPPPHATPYYSEFRISLSS